MSPILIAVFIAVYFAVLILISLRTSKNDGNDAFFTGNKKSAWYVVAFGMIGTSISGVTFISVAGEVGFAGVGEHGFRQFSYLQMVLGYVVGYFIIARVLLPLYYNMNLTSIYTYLEKRFGFWAYKTGAFFFLVSRSIGSALRLFIVANVLQIAVFDYWGIPYAVTVSVTIFLVWLYTFKGGIKTIIWTDTLQTFFLLLAMVMSVFVLASHMNLGLKDLVVSIRDSKYSQVFFWNIDEKKYFFKQFISGIFIAIVMTGLDQDLMQKNLSCKNLKEAQKNMYSFSIIILLVNLVFLCLGSLLYMYAAQKGIQIPAKSDDFYPMMAIKGYLHPLVGFLFIMGLVAATYASTDSALTALTTSVCVDFLDFDTQTPKNSVQIRKWVHLLMSAVIIVIILIFRAINDDSVIRTVFTVAGYTYGPLLGLFSFGLFSKRKVMDKWIPYICLLSPVICFLLNTYSAVLLNGYKFGFEMLLINGFLTYLGMLLISRKGSLILQHE